MPSAPTAEATGTRPFGAARLARLPSGALADVLHLGRTLGALDLAGGVPGSPLPPRAVLEAAAEELLRGDNQYEDTSGNLLLREQLAAGFATPADAGDEVTITTGASEALCVAMLATVDPGDEVILLEPFYENFLAALTTAGAVPRFVRLRAPDWRWDPAELAAAFGPRTRAVVVNSPANPTGRTLTRGELEQLAALCERWDVTVVSDEVYADFVYDGRRHVSVADVPGLRERSIVVGSLSKSHAVSGWRLGFLRARRGITEALRQVHLATSFGANGPLQRAVARSGVLTGDWNPREDMAARRDRAVALFAGLGLDTVAPEGGCYVMAGIRPVTDADCRTFVHRLAERRKVLVVPGRCFFRDHRGDSGYVRVAFNKSPGTLAEAERRLAAGL
ncbi:pyridoxal phosphate-dependent aminotransferase [Streptomyces sp. TRM 70351]|uniref:pyridoxal phosphate-dependent aminotransferase n=1 Tax=Streptomyces sp. TRM 70351 TaxID=3116552 RepID=UPI002E7ACB55|nr:pyridoxal phosphate-dependent aminotransferase [Streptomyces sp. TRM 70351]MEE1930132.1 pyridoxal phosphate-dependent aminotransferase [Streptomyces sp. TRM 70351]